MKRIEWNEFNNKLLRNERSVCFEDVMQIIYEKRILADEANPKKPHQRIYIVEINKYAYLVPYIEDEDKIFLKTIFPSRKATNKYLKGQQQ